MALNGSVSTGGYQGRYLLLGWSATQDVAKNESTITWTLHGAGNASSSYYRAGNFNVTFDNDTVYSTGATEAERITLYNGTLVASGTWKKKHNDDGTCSFSIYVHGAIYSYAVNCKGSGSVTLNTIPRVSQPSTSASSVKMGNSVTIYTNRKSESFTHDIVVTLGTYTKTWKDLVVASVNWSVGDLASYIPNATSGTATISCTTKSGTTVVGTKTCTIRVDVYDATTPTLPTSTTANPKYAGEKITIGLPMKSTNFGHQLYYHFGNESGTVSLDSKNQWSIPIELCSQIPSAWDGTLTITCRTYNGTALVGEKTASLYFKVPDNDTTKPNVTNISLTPITSLGSPFNTLYVQGYSKVKATYTTTAVYSSVKSVGMTVQSKTVTGTSTEATSGILTSHGTNVAVSFLVTNARGQTNTIPATIPTIHEYSKPLVDGLSGYAKALCYRSDNECNEKTNGSYITVKAQRKYSSIGGNNKCKLWYRKKVYDGLPIANNVAKKTLLDFSTSGEYNSVVDGEELFTDTSYTVEVGIEDTIGNSSSIVYFIPTAKATFHLARGGEGAAFGGYSDGDGLLIPWKTRFTGEVQGKVYGLGALPSIPDGADINTYITPGAYRIHSNASAETMTNLPIKKAGRLIVYSSQGSGATSGQWVYILQEFISFDGNYRCVRWLHTDDEADAWTAELWKYTFMGTSQLADYVVEQGVDNQWTYRKWNSGKYDAYYYSNSAYSSITTNATAGALYRSSGTSFPLPSFNKGEVGVSGMGSLTNQWSGIWVYQDKQNLQVIYWSVASATNMSARLSLKIDGYWK